MKRTLVLAAVLCLVALAAADAAVAPQAAANLQSRISNLKSPEAIAIPQMLSYQGKLTDTLGQPVPTGNYALTFRLYTQPTGGSAIWTEAQTIMVKNGLFTALLGAVTPVASVPDSGALYLGLQVAADPELSPRLRIASAAYAYLTARATNADLLQGKDTAALDARYVNEGQANSVTSAMITNATIAAADLGQMGAGSGQVMKWTGTTWAPRNDSVGSGTGPVRGSDIVKPCTLSASVPAMGGVLHVSNTGNGFAIRVDTSGGHGVFVSRAQGSGFYTSRATDGLGVYRAFSNGVAVESAGSAGVNVTRAGSDGFRVRRAMDGVHVDTATQYGLNVQQVTNHGVLVSNAGYCGMYVGRSGLDGVELWKSAYNGVLIDSTGFDGIRVLRPESSGLRVRHAKFRGVHVDTANNDGFNVGRAATSGVYVGTAGTRGVWIDSSGQDGLFVNRAGTNGLYVHRAHDYGVKVDTAGTAGVYVDRVDDVGMKVHCSSNRGLEVDTAVAGLTVNWGLGPESRRTPTTMGFTEQAERRVEISVRAQRTGMGSSHMHTQTPRPRLPSGPMARASPPAAGPPASKVEPKHRA